MARKDAKVSPNFLWRLTIALLLFGLIVLAYEWNTRLTRVPPAEDPVAEYYAEVYHPGPWLEMSRVTSPDGEMDAVLVQDSKSDAGQWVLFILPSGGEVPRETPYRSHRIHLKRLIREAAMVAVQVQGMGLAWTSNEELTVRGESAVFFGKKPVFEPEENGRQVRLEYDFKKSRRAEP